MPRGQHSRAITTPGDPTFHRFTHRKSSASSGHSWFGPKPNWWPGWLPWSPALLILWAPGGFRLTCYYYRGAYYKAFWADPPSCAVGEPRTRYLGEHSFPLIIQNVHRYFLYLALIFLVILAHDVWKALWFEDPTTGQTSFGIGLGTLILAANVRCSEVTRWAAIRCAIWWAVAWTRSRERPCG